MAALLQILRRIGGAKAAPATGNAGELAMYKAGAAAGDAASLYAHDGTQWVEVLDTSAQWKVSGANVYRNTGNVGVGTLTPGYKLTVVTPENNGVFVTDGAVSAIVFASKNGTDQFATIGAVSAHDLVLYAANGERVRIKTDGKVGIGRNDPKADLHVFAPRDALPAQLIVENNSIANTATSRIDAVCGSVDARLLASGAGIAQIGTWSNHGFDIVTNGSPSAHFSKEGNVGIGVTPSATHKLSVRASGTGAFSGVNISSPSTTNDPAGLLRVLTENTHSNNSVAVFGTTTNDIFRIASDGSVQVQHSGTFGYGTGAGGTVTQATSKATAVTLNKPSGKIILANSALAAGATASFTVNNATVSTLDTVYVIVAANSNHSADAYISGPGTFSVRIKNITTSSLSEVFSINFVVIKGSNA